MVSTFSNRWQSLNQREQWIVGLGGLCVVGLVAYFMVIEPLQNKTQRLNAIADKQSQQLTEMQTMAEALLAEKQQPSAESLLKPHLVLQQKLTTGEKLSQTGTVPTEKALTWLPQLVAQGKVRYVVSGSGVKIYFWGQE